MSKYLPVCFSNHDLRLPKLNWQCSVSVDVFNFADTTPYKVFWQTEPPEIMDTEAKLIKNHKFYDLILTWNANVLSYCGNAKLFPAGAVWTIEPDTSQKQFQASFLISSKNLCYGHKLRHELFDALPDVIKCAPNGIVGTPLPILKHRSPPYLPDKRDMLVPFQYSIVMENGQYRNNFTEKINDACATKTIPVYWGPANIGDFYNKDGILSWDGTQELLDLLQGLKPDFYESKREAIEENYNKAMKYVDRTGNLVRAIEDSWTPKIDVIHSGEPNVG